MPTFTSVVFLSSVIVSLTGQVSKIVPEAKVKQSFDISQVIVLAKGNNQSPSKPAIPSPRRGDGRREAAKGKT